MVEAEAERLRKVLRDATEYQRGSTLWVQANIMDYLTEPGDYEKAFGYIMRQVNDDLAWRKQQLSGA